MSALYDKIKEDQLQYRKEKDTTRSAALTYLLGEVSRQRTQDLSDKNILSTIKTTVKRLEDSYLQAPTSKGLLEIRTLKAFLPKELSGGDLEVAIRALEFNSIGEAMGKIKQWNIPVNMKQASILIQGML